MRRHLPPEAAYWLALMRLLRSRIEHARKHPDDGMSAELMVLIGALVLVAIAAMAIVTAKIIEKANSIKL
ncbi:hypothetical protein HII36_09645 [Nonomuraea sp. NN258]|uniref:hypothetical protein n=1 Tax=Nonomuraea antri TaxID=2730852 RepID=UPI001568C207|nr:hypothetical protein [Nonomuraea antri]NRQ32099.1 hypothetical protein [Nonomuraea antri]